MKKNYKFKTLLSTMLLCFVMVFSINSKAQCIIGTGTTTTDGTGADPVERYYNYEHFQMVYTAAELSAGGMSGGSTITGMGFSISESAVSLANYTIDMGLTLQATANPYISTGLTNVKSSFTYAPTVVAAGSFDMIVLSTPFIWDGTSNIVVNTCTGSNPFASPYGGLRYSTVATGGVRYSRQDGSSNCGVATTTNGTTRPNIRFDYTGGSPCSGTPTAGVTAGPASVCSGVVFTLNLTGATSGVSGLTYQWQSSPDGITYSNIIGATSSTTSVSQTVATFYQCIVTCTASGLSATSTPFNVAMNPFFSCYCMSGATYTADEDIYNVTVGSLNNSSTCSTTGGTGSVLNSYSNFTAVAAPPLGQSATVSFSIEIGTCGGLYNNSTAIYIDFNQNGSFSDPGEQVYTSALPTNGPHIETGTFTVPLTATLGLTGMRVVTVESGTPSPCGTYGWGETEDYTVDITLAPACMQPTALTATAITSTSATFGWTAGGTETAWDVYYGATPLAVPTGATVPTVSTVTNSYTAALSSLTSYQYYVRADCGAGSTSAWSGPFNFNTICGGTTCNYVFVLSDLYGGWEGASIDIKQNGVLIQTITQTGYPYVDSVIVPLCDGVATTLGWNRGSYPNECSFALYNPYGALLTQFSNGSTIAEDSVFATFAANCTPPACPQPTGVVVSNIGTDSAVVTWSCPTCTGPYIIEFDSTGFTPGSGNIDTVPSSPYIITGLSEGTTYQVYVSQDCSGTGDGTSTVAGPSTFTTIVSYDNVCGAFPLVIGTNGPFSTTVGTVQAGEPVPPASGCGIQTGWCNNTLTNSLWFAFVAPASGRVSVQSPDFDTQLAVWDALTCDTILQGGATLLGANDDDPNSALHGGVSVSSYVGPLSCLTPGKTYYVQLDAYSSPGASTRIILTDLGFPDASFTALDSTYCSVDPTVALVPVQSGGVFSGPGVSGSTFNPSVAGIGTHNIVYKLSPCDSMVQTVIVDSIPMAAYTYFDVANTITFTNTSTGNSTNSWNFGDGSPVSAVISPVHVFAANGAYNVQLIVTSGCGADTVMYTITITGIGINELTNGSISIYPNPTNGVFNVSIVNSNISELTISVVDIQGKEVFSTSDKNISAAYAKEINLEYLAKGLYYVKFSTSAGVKVQKLIIH